MDSLAAQLASTATDQTFQPFNEAEAFGRHTGVVEQPLQISRDDDIMSALEVAVARQQLFKGPSGVAASAFTKAVNTLVRPLPFQTFDCKSFDLIGRSPGT